MPTHQYLETEILTINSVAMLEQIRTLDNMRLTQPIGCVTKEIMKKIDKALIISFGL